MGYILAFISRGWAAIGTLYFWVELLVVLPLSCLGIWLPWLFNWTGSEIFLNPVPWFTFGVAALMIILTNRLFMPEEEDKYLMANRLVLILACVIAAIMYGKSMHDFINVTPNSVEEFDYKNTKNAIYITLVVWFINYVHVDKFDSTSVSSPLGGDV